MSARFLRSVCFITLFILLSLFSEAQIRYNLEHYSSEDGLSHDNVTSIIKDHEGFMWFATWDGICRYDGHNFITYKSRPGDSSQLKSTRIDYIVEDQNGYLWIKGYDSQIYRFDKKTAAFLSVSDIINKENNQDIGLNKIIVTTNGMVWLTSTKKGVFCIKNPASPNLQIVIYGKGMENGLQ